MQNMTPESPTPHNAPAASSTTRLPIRTYHCRPCSHLLLATTHDITRLPRRRDPALDGALILPLPRRKAAVERREDDEEAEHDVGEAEEEEEEEEEEDETSEEALDRPRVAGARDPGSRLPSRSSPNLNADTAGAVVEGTKTTAAPTRTTTTTISARSTAEDSAPNLTSNSLSPRRGGGHYAILLSTIVPDRRPTVIRREDGFEKRLFLRCGRCRVVLGYFLDRIHFKFRTGKTTVAGRVGGRADEGDDGPDGNDEDGDGDEKPKVVYILPGALVETGDMADGEKMVAEDQEWVGWARE